MISFFFAGAETENIFRAVDFGGGKPVKSGAMKKEDTPKQEEERADARPPFRHVKAYENLDFLNSPVARTIRVHCEMLEPYYRLYPYSIRKTIVFFGSARTLPKADAEEALERERRKVAELPLTEAERKLRIAVAERNVANAHYYEEARKLARDLTQWSKEYFSKPGDRYYICSGGGPGIMEAANRGAFEAGGKSLGLGISLPFEQHPNPFITPELDFEFRYFFIRKYWFLYLAHALIAFPGGYGTMDELFEMLTLIQTRKTPKKIPIVLFGREFWEKLINFEVFVELGYISPEDLSLFRYFDKAEEAREYIIREVTTGMVEDEKIPGNIGAEDALHPHHLDLRRTHGGMRKNI